MTNNPSSRDSRPERETNAWQSQLDLASAYAVAQAQGTDTSAVRLDGALRAKLRQVRALTEEDRNEYIQRHGNDTGFDYLAVATRHAQAQADTDIIVASGNDKGLEFTSALVSLYDAIHAAKVANEGLSTATRLLTFDHTLSDKDIALLRQVWQTARQGIDNLRNQANLAEMAIGRFDLDADNLIAAIQKGKHNDE